MNPRFGLSIIGVNAEEPKKHPDEGVESLANQTGKRYVCAKCGSEFIVTKGGEGAIVCCQTPMELK